MKSGVLVFVPAFLLLAACSKDALKPAQTAEAVKPVVTVAKVDTNASEKKDDAPHVAQAVSNMLGLDSEIVRLCNLHLDVAPSEEGAPRFDTDESELSSQDAQILQQVATCLTNGPLAGKHVQLVGRADARGTTEYNMVLGEHRASAVGHYLEEKGVTSPRISSTSRGELDATGSDDTSMRNDRRVDIMLGS
ncbi:MAG TPA: OmpA family protein [Polyangiaceae bacterium]|jgi:peptidoglycan-associated lipoprotein|nr:OmpA family protein [Polyangiaceae bacterium]